jgi:hypothetical protein
MKEARLARFPPLGMGVAELGVLQGRLERLLSERGRRRRGIRVEIGFDGLGGRMVRGREIGNEGLRRRLCAGRLGSLIGGESAAWDAQRGGSR